MIHDRDKTSVWSSNELLTASLTERDDAGVLTFLGFIDAASGNFLDAVVKNVLNHQFTALVVDLSAVKFLGSPALRVLVTLQESISKFAVVADDPVVVRPIQITGLDKLLRLYPSLDEALAALSTRTSCRPDRPADSAAPEPGT